MKITFYSHALKLIKKGFALTVGSFWKWEFVELEKMDFILYPLLWIDLLSHKASIYYLLVWLLLLVVMPCETNGHS